MRLDRYAAAADFLDSAGSWLAEREAEHNLMLGVAGTVAAEGDDDEPAIFVTVRAGSELVAAAIRTPPANLILSETDRLDAVDRIAEAMQGEGLPGAVGPPAVVARFAEAWTADGRHRWAEAMRERIFRLQHVTPPRPVAGAMRPATPDDRALLIEWLAAFRAEALREHDTSRIPEIVDAWIAGRGRQLSIWEDGGPVSLVGAGGQTPHGVRIGPVYTPPDHRGRGYASALTAAVSQAQLDSGRQFCFLYTDLTNPIANRIYQAIGYEPVTDALMVRFIPT